MDKKQLEQRKVTRLLQVRQQAKDFARKVRENVLLESMCQQKRVIEEKKRKLILQRDEKLKLLEEIYHSCLENVGEGHKNASMEPNINEIKKVVAVQKAADASKRGKNAIKKHFEHVAINQQQKEVPIMRKKNIRTRENLRSCLISSLPKPEWNQKYLPTNNSKNQTRPVILKEIPTNLTGPHPAFNEDESTGDKYQPINFDSLEDCQNRQTEVQDYSNQCLCAHLACCCHSDIRGAVRRRCYSDSICSTEGSVTEFLHKSNTKRSRLRSRSCSPRVVQTLNYTDSKNLYESKQTSLINVVQHQDKGSEAKQGDLKGTENRSLIDRRENLRREELKRKTEERCAKALNREQLKKDFQQLLSDLGKLSQNRLLLKNKNNLKPLIQREREIEAKNKIKQEKLVEAFEKLLNSEKTAEHRNSNTRSTEHTGEDWSPPSLNLAAYSNYYRNKKSESGDHKKNYRQKHTSKQQLGKELNYQTDSLTDQENCDSTGRQMSSKSSPGHRATRSQSPCSSRSNPSGISRKSGESGEVIVRVRIDGQRPHKRKCRKSRSHHAQLDSSTSYFSPPENLTPSQKRLLDALLTQVNNKTIGEDLKAYIKTLLSMSRESIDELNVSTSSSTACTESVKSPTESRIRDDVLYLSSLTEKYADKVSELVDMFDRMDSPEPADCYMEPPLSLQSQTVPAEPMSPCPPVSSPTYSSGTHDSSQCRYCQPATESDSRSERKSGSKRKLRPKTPPPRPRQYRAQVKHGQQIETVPGAEINCNPMESNVYKKTTPTRGQSPCPPDHPHGYSDQRSTQNKPPCPSAHPSVYSTLYLPSNKPPCLPNQPPGNPPQHPYHPNQTHLHLSQNRNPCPPTQSPSMPTQNQYPCPPSQSPVKTPQNQYLCSPSQSPVHLQQTQGYSGTKSGASSSSFKARDIQTPFSLSSNLLPHPKEVFGQQAAAHTRLSTISEKSEGCKPCPDITAARDDSMRWLFEADGIPPPPPSNIDPQKLADKYRQEFMPDQDAIRTPNSSFDMAGYMDEAERRMMKSVQQEHQVTPDNLCESDRRMTAPDSDDSAVFFSTSYVAVDEKQDDGTSGSEDNLRDCVAGKKELDVISREKILSPIQLRKLRQRISEVCFEHRTRIADYLLNDEVNCETEQSD